MSKRTLSTKPITDFFKKKKTEPDGEGRVVIATQACEGVSDPCPPVTNNPASARHDELETPLPLEDANYVKFRPGPSFSYPKRVLGQDEKKRQRCCSAKLLDEHSWAHYNIGKDLIFCDVCVKATKRGFITMTNRLEKAFTHTGFCNWNDPGRLLSKHANSGLHKEAVMKLSMQSKPPINALLDTQVKEDQKLNNTHLVYVIKALKYLSRQSLAIRGAAASKDDEAKVLEPDSNFFQLLQLLVDESGNPKLVAEQIKYTAPSIQNELLDIMAGHILRQLLEEIKQARYYAILTDDSSDISNKEQMCLVLRWIDSDLLAHETFLGLRQLERTNAENIAANIRDCLLRFNLPLTDCRGQCYDGAAVMSGAKNGVAALISKENPKAFYVHCHSHALNLAVQDSVKGSTLLKETMVIVSEIASIIRSSPKRNSMLEALKDEIPLDGDESRAGRITSFCPTRWTVRADTMSKIVDNYQHLLQLWPLLKAETGDSTSYNRIMGVEAKMQNYKFLFGLQLGILVFRHSDRLSTALQAPKLSAANAKSMAEKTVKVLKSLRSTNEYENLKELVSTYQEKLRVEGPKDKRKTTAPRWLDENSETATHLRAEDEYRVQYMEVFDLVIAGIYTRFDQPGLKVYGAIEECLLRKDDNYSQLKFLCDLYAIDFETAKSEFFMLSKDDSIEGDCLVDFVDSFRKDLRTNQQVYPNVCKLLLVALILPATNATSERSFSALKRLKTALRNSMSQERLNSLLLLHTYKERCDALEPQVIIKEFVMCHPKRLKTIAIL